MTCARRARRARRAIWPRDLVEQRRRVHRARPATSTGGSAGVAAARAAASATRGSGAGLEPVGRRARPSASSSQTRQTPVNTLSWMRYACARRRPGSTTSPSPSIWLTIVERRRRQRRPGRARGPRRPRVRIPVRRAAPGTAPAGRARRASAAASRRLGHASASGTCSCRAASRGTAVRRRPPAASRGPTMRTGIGKVLHRRAPSVQAQ